MISLELNILLRGSFIIKDLFVSINVLSWVKNGFTKYNFFNVIYHCFANDTNFTNFDEIFSLMATLYFRDVKTISRYYFILLFCRKPGHVVQINQNATDID